MSKPMTNEELITGAVRSYETYLRAMVRGDLEVQELACRNSETAEKEIRERVALLEQAERQIASNERRSASRKRKSA